MQPFVVRTPAAVHKCNKADGANASSNRGGQEEVKVGRVWKREDDGTARMWMADGGLF